VTAVEFVARRLWRELNPVAWYEDLAGLFFRKTGRMAPGKSEPMGFGGRSQEYEAETRRLWDAFTKRLREQALAEMRSIVGEALIETCEHGFCGTCSRCDPEAL
jgi:hypothetical protein